MSFLPIVRTGAIISRHGKRDDLPAGADLPERGPPVEGKNLGNKPRLLVGWRHQNDNPQDLQEGRIWCWVGGEKFQVYDESYNRSEKAGEVRFCGPANFTMVRMFHPWFAICGVAVPQDKVSGDKEWCRQQYREAMQKYRDLDAAAGIVPDSNDEDMENSSSDEDQHMSIRRIVKPKKPTKRPYRYENSSDADSDTDESDEEGIGGQLRSSNSEESDSENQDITQSGGSPSSNAGPDTVSHASDNNTMAMKEEFDADDMMVIETANNHEMDENDALLASLLQTTNRSQASQSSQASLCQDFSPSRLLHRDAADHDCLFIPEDDTTRSNSYSPSPGLPVVDSEHKTIKVEGVEEEADRSRQSSQGTNDDPIEID